MQVQHQKLVTQFLKAPFQNFCGLRDVEAGDGVARANLSVGEDLQNMSGYLHGGVVYAMLDVVAFCAAVSVMEENDYPVTNGINITMYRPVKVGSKITFASKVRKKGKRLVVTHCEVFEIISDQQTLVAEGLVTKTILSNGKNVQFIENKGD